MASGRRWRHEPLFDGRGAVDLGVVLSVRRNADLRGDPEIVGHIEVIKPAVERFFGASDGDLDFRAVIVVASGRVGRERLLGFDGESGGPGLSLGELLELGLDVLIGARLRLVGGEPVHLVSDLFAAGTEVFGGFEFLARLILLVRHFDALGLVEANTEKIDHGKSRDAEEGEKFFFAG